MIEETDPEVQNYICQLKKEIGRLNLLLNGNRKLSKCCGAPLDEFYSIKRKRCLGCGNWYNWPLGNKEPVFDGKHES